MVGSRILIAASAVTLFTLAGCGSGLGQRRLDYSDTEQVKITQITVAPGSGDIVVRTAAASSTTEIKRVVRYRGAEPSEVKYRIEGTRLFIDTDCGRQCGLSYEIVAPTGVSVSGENGSGDVTLTGVGDVKIKVGSGDIEVSDAAGAVNAETGSGDISVTNATGAVTMRTGSGNATGRGLGGKVDTETGSGDISLVLQSAAPARAHAASGDVDLAVPGGSYRVQASTGSGNKQITVPEDPSATLLLDVGTGSGDLTIRQS